MPGNKKPKKKVKLRSFQSPAPIIKPAPKPPEQLTEREHKLLAEEPHRALGRMMLGTMTLNDWYTVAFRIGVGLGLAQIAYSKEVEEVLDRGKTAVFYLINRREKTARVPDHELCQLLSMCLDAVDDMQLEIVRDVQIEVSKKVFAELKKLNLSSWPGGTSRVYL